MDGDSDPKRSTICGICGAQTGNFHLNYGASTCLSCRAFFRRTVQRDESPKFLCKGDGKNPCEINERNRKKCKRCRFQACLTAGMKTDQVMSSEVKQTWFRKMYKKKAKDQVPPETPEPRSVNPRRAKYVSMVSEEPSECSLMSLPMIGGCSSNPLDSGFMSTFTTNGGHDDDNSLNVFGESLKVEWAILVSGLNFHPVLVQAATSSPQDQIQVTKTMVKDHAELIESAWVQFCRCNPDFCSLSPRDQSTLLVQNKRMFTTAVLSRFFASSMRDEQLEWLFLGQEAPKAWALDGCGHFSFTHWNTHQGLILDVPTLMQTVHLMELICSFPMPVKHIGILAYHCLFYVSTSSDHLFENPDAIYNFSLKTTSLAPLVQVDPNQLQSHVENLKDLSRQVSAWNWDTIEGSIPHSPTQSYGDLEENILQAEFHTMDQIFKEVPLGQDVVEELISYAMDVPVSKGFMRRAMMTWKQRFKLIMCQHQEFQTLPDVDQAILVEKTCLPTFGVAKLWSENLPTVRAQMEFALGVSDISFLMERISPILPSLTPKKLTVDGLNKSAKLVDKKTMDRFDTLKNGLKYLVSDNEFYKITFLMTMFLPAAKSHAGHAIGQLSSKYLHILIRRSKHLSLADEAAINQSIKLIAEIGELMKVIFGFAPSANPNQPMARGNIPV